MKLLVKDCYATLKGSFESASIACLFKKARLQTVMPKNKVGK